MAMVCMVTVFYHFIFFKSDESINILYCVLRYNSAFFNYMHMAHPNGRVCGAKRPKCEAERSHHL